MDNWLHTFLKALFPQPASYKELLHKPYEYTLKYFVYFILISQILYSFIFGLQHLFSFPSPLEKKMLIEKSFKTVAPDFRLYLHDKTLHTNYDQPYFIWLTTKNDLFPFIVIDEYAFPSKIEEYGSEFLFTSQYIIYKNEHTFKTIAYPKFDINWSQKDIAKHSARLTALYSLWELGLALQIVIVKPLILLCTTLFFLLFVSWISSHVLKRKHGATYQKLFQMGLYVSTVPILSAYIIWILGGHVGLFYYILLLLFYLGAVYEVFIYKESIK